MRLTAADDDQGSYGLYFDHCTLRSFTNLQTSRPISGLVNAKVTSIDLKPEKSLRLGLGEVGEVVISLAVEDHDGPEAFAAHFSDGSIVVG
ncbi:MAG: hypothetical protein KF686_14195 [Ramlibacter sp.]|nr:hypothetical protein [Ramlibacter sp.]